MSMIDLCITQAIRIVDEGRLVVDLDADLHLVRGEAQFETLCDDNGMIDGTEHLAYMTAIALRKQQRELRF